MKTIEFLKTLFPNSVKILFCLIGFVVVVFIGLDTANVSFNDLTGKEDKGSIVSFSKNMEGGYELDIFGRQIRITEPNINEIGGNLSSFCNRCKDLIIEFGQKVIEKKTNVFYDN